MKADSIITSARKLLVGSAVKMFKVPYLKNNATGDFNLVFLMCKSLTLCGHKMHAGFVQIIVCKMISLKIRKVSLVARKFLIDQSKVNPNG